MLSLGDCIHHSLVCIVQNMHPRAGVQVPEEEGIVRLGVRGQLNDTQVRFERPGVASIKTGQTFLLEAGSKCCVSFVGLGHCQLHRPIGCVAAKSMAVGQLALYDLSLFN